jgi:hypothetical protein
MTERRKGTYCQKKNWKIRIEILSLTVTGDLDRVHENEIKVAKISRIAGSEHAASDGG